MSDTIAKIEFHPDDVDSTVRTNMIKDVRYRPYCGSVIPSHPNYLFCSSPRTNWDSKLSQMRCRECGWISEFPDDFIQRYKQAHNIN